MVTRTELYDLLWTEPAQTVAKRFDVSVRHLAEICERLRIPTPTRGYWSKIASGKIMPQATLLPPRLGDEISWEPSGDGTGNFGTNFVDELRHEKLALSESELESPVESTHELLVNVKPLFLSGRLSYRKEYLKPSKRLLPDLQASKSGFDVILQFANAFFNALEQKGCKVEFDPTKQSTARPTLDVREKPNRLMSYDNLWKPLRNTVILNRNLKFGVTIFELTENIPMRNVKGKYIRDSEYVPRKKGGDHSTWVSNLDMPSGRIGFQIYFRYYGLSWSKVWRESKSGEFLAKIKSLVRESMSQYDQVLKLIEIEKVKVEARRLESEEATRKWNLRVEQERIDRSNKESRESLLVLRNRFEENNRWKFFFAHLVEVAQSLAPEDSKTLLSKVEEMKKILVMEDPLETYMNWSPPVL